MDKIIWDERYTLGVEEIDSQHRRLFALLDRLHEAIGQGSDHEEMKKIVMELVRYADEHFSAEESLMQDADQLVKRIILHARVPEAAIVLPVIVDHVGRRSIAVDLDDERVDAVRVCLLEGTPVGLAVANAQLAETAEDVAQLVGFGLDAE